MNVDLSKHPRYTLTPLKVSIARTPVFSMTLMEQDFNSPSLDILIVAVWNDEESDRLHCNGPSKYPWFTSMNVSIVLTFMEDTVFGL
ncbi:hypothetical protein WICPIJ_004013 [Wickerhamomyces pijperi]|uniref:Uncharacterized protein n=1 Tax=Wickerhamomyces pijperi TaxID=599730 RepID=A0A9P8Q8R2_WICPI|nr:hypothetical protein WICPIJ_004013 [Wickerhamomyces pijperi]